MTEAEWKSCSDPNLMLDDLCGKVSDRKLRLLAVAFCRQLDAFLYKPGRAPIQASVDIAEHFADGLATEAERQAAWTKEDEQWDRGNYPSCSYFVVTANSFKAAQQSRVAAYSLYDEYEGRSAAAKLRRAQCQLIREVFDYAFYPVAFDPGLLAPTVLGVAQNCYEDRAFHMLPILAVALEAVGCDNPHLLNHLFHPGPHVRGCWALDLVLDKK